MSVGGDSEYLIHSFTKTSVCTGVVLPIFFPLECLYIHVSSNSEFTVSNLLEADWVR